MAFCRHVRGCMVGNDGSRKSLSISIVHFCRAVLLGEKQVRRWCFGVMAGEHGVDMLEPK
ncbi:hypothetical protein [Bartonella sp. AU18XJBT]|uniref:hypothetical protein n=1 Tax=Bartonella sp. AU18XJBT TaxID=3019089 RepID=UPI00235FCC56|nr:hypothetical protein [Bartonella sp. AU18XJBT]